MNRSLIRIVACFCFWPLLVCAKKKPTEQTVEIKCLIPDQKIGEFSRKVGLRSRAPLTRVVCFFDTGTLTLFQHKPTVILRSRYDSSDETDTTVKVREGKVPGDDVECEWDKVLGKKRIMSCSVTSKNQAKSQIMRANAGKDVKKIFSEEQEATVRGAFGKVDWKTLRPYGPVRSVQVWKRIKLPGGPDLTVERWELPARPRKPARVLFEVSAKVPLADEAKTSKWIAGLVGVAENSEQQSETKTRLVLDHFR